MALSGNKGEWSEIYALFKLLGDGKVYAGNGNMERIGNLFYPILRVIRNEEHKYEYAPLVNDGRVVAIYEDGAEIMRLPMDRFSQMAGRLLRLIKDAKGAAFSFPNVEDFMNSIKCRALKARSLDKSDIRIIIHDLRTGLNPLLGFSIKSQLGHPSTLLNSGTTTNFTYRVKDASRLTDAEIRRLNSIEGQIERMKDFFQSGYDISYLSMDCETFEDNLIIIDSMLPEILAEGIKEHFISGVNDLKDITSALIRRNPIGVRTPNQYYKAKMKSLLIDTALGMTPAKAWTRQYDANGGYLVVKDDGEILCYHFYDKNQLEDYLFNNTRFDYPSRSRHHYGNFYRGDDGNVLIKLNFQIRFK